MSEQDRQERITETLALLGQLTPADLQTNRDELFFRAGEASARSELAVSSLRRFAWPAVAATLALVAAGLGYSIANRGPEIQIVYVERPSKQSPEQPKPRPTSVDSVAEQTPETHIASRETRRGLGTNSKIDLIHPQDWAALSDAFAEQLRLQYEQSDSLAGLGANSAGQDADQSFADETRPRPATYLELRDSLRPM